MLAQLNGRAAEILMQRFACYTDLHVGQNCTRYLPVSVGVWGGAVLVDVDVDALMS